MLRSTLEAGTQASSTANNKNNPDNTDPEMELPPAISSATPNGTIAEVEPVHKSVGSADSEKQNPVLGKRKRTFISNNSGADGEDFFQKGKRNRMTEVLPPVATILTDKKVKQTTASTVTSNAISVEPVKKIVHIDPEVCDVSQERTASGTRSRKGRSPSPPPVLPPSPVFKRETTEQRQQDKKTPRKDITVTVKPITGSAFDFQFKSHASVCALKEQICWLTGITPDRQVLAIHGQSVDNDDYRTLQSFTPEPQLTVQTVSENVLGLQH